MNHLIAQWRHSVLSGHISRRLCTVSFDSEHRGVFGTRATYERPCLLASRSEKAQDAKKELESRYTFYPSQDADVIVALGGDGFMLSMLHRTMKQALPIFGMNKGTVGFLMNNFRSDGLLERLQSAQISDIIPLQMTAFDRSGHEHHALAINEISLFRQSRQAAQISIAVDGRSRMQDLICDGVMVATPAGSTAYNLSAHGPVLPLGADLLALTPISAFRPRRWRGALLRGGSRVTLTSGDPDKRPVSATADFSEVRNVVRVDIRESEDYVLKILHDPETSLDEKILQEQFMS